VGLPGTPFRFRGGEFFRFGKLGQGDQKTGPQRCSTPWALLPPGFSVCCTKGGFSPPVWEWGDV